MLLLKLLFTFNFVFSQPNCLFPLIHHLETWDINGFLSPETSTKCGNMFAVRGAINVLLSHQSILLCADCRSQWQLSSSARAGMHVCAHVCSHWWFKVWKLASSNTQTCIDGCFQKSYWSPSAGLVALGQFTQFSPRLRMEIMRRHTDLLQRANSTSAQELITMKFNRQFNNWHSILGIRFDVTVVVAGGQTLKVLVVVER